MLLILVLGSLPCSDILVPAPFTYNLIASYFDRCSSHWYWSPHSFASLPILYVSPWALRHCRTSWRHASLLYNIALQQLTGRLHQLCHNQLLGWLHLAEQDPLQECLSPALYRWHPRLLSRSTILFFVRHALPILSGPDGLYEFNMMPSCPHYVAFMPHLHTCILIQAPQLKLTQRCWPRGCAFSIYTYIWRVLYLFESRPIVFFFQIIICETLGSA